MRTTTKFTIALVVLIVAGGTLASQFIPVREATTQLRSYTSNAGELTRDTLIGQTFVANRNNLSAVSIMFATYSGRDNTEPIKFHIREGINSAIDLRIIEVDPSELGDNQFYRFKFEPIAESKGKTFFFFVVSPTSSKGNAITVDLDTQDPYHLGTAFLVRDRGSAVTDPSVLAKSGKPTVDVVFETYNTVPLRMAASHQATKAVRTFIGTWDDKQDIYQLWGRAALPAVLLLIVVWMIYGMRFGPATWLPILFVGAMIFRILYALDLPVTNDEGNYLYDAQTLLRGKLAGGDGYVKAPLVVLWIAFWQFIFGNTILAGRLSSIVAGSLTIFPIYYLAREMWGKREGIVAAAIWALVGSAIVFSIYVHTQPLALLFGISGLAALLMALRGIVPHLSFITPQKVPAAMKWFVMAGILLGLGVASRKSILALGLVPILLIMIEGESWKLRMKHFVAVGVGFLIIIGILMGSATLVYGQEGLWEALGVNSAEDGINAVTPEEEENVRAYSIRGMTPFFRESMVLILLAVIGLGVASERMIRAAFGYLKKRPDRSVTGLIDIIIPKIGWLVPVIAFVWAWSFFNEYEGSAFHILGIPSLWWVMALTILLFAVLPRPKSEALQLPDEPEIVPQSRQPDYLIKKLVDQPKRINPQFRFKLTAALIIPLWILGLVIFYTNWIKFHANYISEFIPPLVLLAALGLPYIFKRLRATVFFAKDYPPVEVARRLFVGIMVLIIFWALYVSSYITFLYEHTGTFQQRSAQEAAQFAENVIPKNESIFTGAALIPYLSGHRTALDIAHPRWYAYEFTRTDTERINTFLPSAEEMVQAFREAKWVLLEKQTGFSFLMEYSEIEKSLFETGEFESVQGIENGSNTLTFYRRVR